MTTKEGEGKLRFAPLIRVSTEGQEKQGESLRTQTTQILQFVKSLGGTIPESCWQYCGQEHATPDYERRLLDKLLADAGKGLFDAVIVCDASRWSRDNLKSKKGLEILKKQGIRFFGGTVEYNLYNPEHSFFLGVSAEIGELQARQQSLKSLQNRIERARRGCPTSGKIPYGRTFDKKSETWGLDKAKVKLIKQAAKRYLAGEAILDIASSYGMNATNLWKVLNHRSGDTWEIQFRAENLNIDETVELRIPRLLPETVIAAIHAKGRANKTYTHGEILHKYLLSRMIFCSHCGYALSGQVNHTGKRYYRHNTKHRKPGCTMEKRVPADLIENAALIELIQTFGDVERIRRAVERATPDMKKIEGLMDERETLTLQLAKTIAKKDNVVDMVAEGGMTKEEVTKRMEPLRETEDKINNRLNTIKALLENIPDPARVKRLSKLGMAVLADATKDPKLIFKKSYEWKRNLVEHAFAGRDVHNDRLGVYVSETGDETQPWQFEIRGVLENTIMSLPLSDDYLADAFMLDPEFQDVESELRQLRQSLNTNFPLSTPCT